LCSPRSVGVRHPGRRQTGAIRLGRRLCSLRLRRRLVFFDRSMRSEAPLGAVTARPAVEPVWVAADFDRSCEVRLRGWCSDLLAGLFVFAALVACLLVCLLGHRLRPPDPHRACRDAYTTTSPALGGQAGRRPRRGRRHGQQCLLCRGSRAQCEPDNDFPLRGQLLKTPPLVVGQSAVSTQRPVYPMARCFGDGATLRTSVSNAFVTASGR
jgi:hypothetical protein